MPKNINSAYRIKNAINSVRNNNESIKTINVWSDYFNITEEDSQKRSFMVSRCLTEMHEEIEIVRDEMSRLDFSHELYDNALNRSNSIFSVQSINTEWREIKSQISNDILISLGFCSEILPHEENEVSDIELNELVELLSELKLKLTKSTLPMRLQRIIEAHINKINDALSLYKIKGVTPLDEAIKLAFGEVIKSKELIEENKNSEEVKTLYTIWRKSISALDAVVTADSKITAIQNMAGYGLKLLDFIQHTN